MITEMKYLIQKEREGPELFRRIIKFLAGKKAGLQVVNHWPEMNRKGIGNEI